MQADSVYADYARQQVAPAQIAGSAADYVVSSGGLTGAHHCIATDCGCFNVGGKKVCTSCTCHILWNDDSGLSGSSTGSNNNGGGTSTGTNSSGSNSGATPASGTGGSSNQLPSSTNKINVGAVAVVVAGIAAAIKIGVLL